MSSDPTPMPADLAPRENVFTLMWRRFWTLWHIKLLLVLIITPVFLACYLGIQKLMIGKGRTLPETWIDDLAGFDPWWVYIYVSQYLIVPLPPLLAHTRPQLRALAVGLTTTSALSFIVFLVFPVAAMRPPMPAESNWVYNWLISVDGVVNSFPSLHVGLSSFVAMYAHRVIDREFSRPARLTLLAIIWVWTLLICWSTMATKQHYFVDILGGFVFAYIGHRVAWGGPVDREGGTDKRSPRSLSV